MAETIETTRARADPVSRNVAMGLIAPWPDMAREAAERPAKTSVTTFDDFAGARA